MSLLTPEQRADQFIQEEQQFHLGFLITEQSHPKTRGLSEALAENARRGLEKLYSVDDDLPPVLDRVLDSEPFARLVSDLTETLAAGGRIFFSGCGATGRLSILLDSANRRYWERVGKRDSSLTELAETMAHRTSAVMTGGDYALVRSVESFEDYIPFGRRQMKDAGVSGRDAVVAISEGGETSSVIGTLLAGLDVGARCHFLFNNPADLLADHIERSKRVIRDERVNVLDLTTGPMGIAGSTRMQATTMELLVAGMALEAATNAVLTQERTSSSLPTLPPEKAREIGLGLLSPRETARCFQTLLAQLRTDENLDAAAAFIDFEAGIYRDGGRVTYFADRYLLDIFTDTTERAPTFKTPPFRPEGDTLAPAPWAFVKDPLRPTEEAWRRLLLHEPRCLEWTPADYRTMDAAESIIADPPKIGREILFRFRIGNESDSSRTETPANAAIALLGGTEIADALKSESPWSAAFDRASADFAQKTTLAIGPAAENPPADASGGTLFFVRVDIPETPLDLFGHLAVKLVLNNVSTSIMGKIGRLSSNWMAHVEASNKKLIDRSIRLVSELAGVEYRDAAIALFETMDEMADWPEKKRRIISPAARTVEKITRSRDGGKTQRKSE